jgi:pectate disaccharide-lyase
MKTQLAFLAAALSGFLPASLSVAAEGTAKPVAPPAHLSSSAAVSSATLSVSDFGQLDAAVQALASSTAGGTILLKAGRYLGTHPLVLSRTNSAASKAARKTIHVWAEPGPEVILDFSALRDDDTAAGQGITITGDGYHLKGLTVERAGSIGIHVRGSRNIIENCVTRHNGDTGLQIGLLRGATNEGHLASDNLVLNCDSYRNFDPFTVRADTGKPAPGNDADGFGCRREAGTGNRFEGCRSWENADDGWDFYKSNVGVEVVNCWSWHQGDSKVFTGEYDCANGHRKDPNLFDLNKPHPKAPGTTVAQHLGNWGGNGNGFKLGGENSKGRHRVTNCVAFDHNYGQKGQKGFDENNNRDRIILVGCTAFNNIENYCFPYASTSPGLFVFTNNVGFAGQLKDELGGFSDGISVPPTEDQKRIMDAVWKAARAPRKPGGNLPELTIR